MNVAQEQIVLLGGVGTGQLDQTRQHARHLHHRQALAQFPVLVISSCTMLLRDLLSNWGKGWAGSKPSGVRTGRTWVR